MVIEYVVLGIVAKPLIGQRFVIIKIWIIRWNNCDRCKIFLKWMNLRLRKDTDIEFLWKICT